MKFFELTFDFFSIKIDCTIEVIVSSIGIHPSFFWTRSYRATWKGFTLVAVLLTSL